MHTHGFELNGNVTLKLSHGEFKILWESLAQFVENYPLADPDPDPLAECDHNPVEFETSQAMLEKMDAILADLVHVKGRNET